LSASIFCGGSAWKNDTEPLAARAAKETGQLINENSDPGRQGLQLNEDRLSVVVALS